MSIEQVSDLFREAIAVALLVSAPMLLVAMALGLVISVLQAVCIHFTLLAKVQRKFMLSIWTLLIII